jgi:hypothetical protein
MSECAVEEPVACGCQFQIVPHACPVPATVVCYSCTEFLTSLHWRYVTDRLFCLYCHLYLIEKLNARGSKLRGFGPRRHWPTLRLLELQDIESPEFLRPPPPPLCIYCTFSFSLHGIHVKFALVLLIFNPLGHLTKCFENAFSHATLYSRFLHSLLCYLV